MCVKNNLQITAFCFIYILKSVPIFLDSVSQSQKKFHSIEHLHLLKCNASMDECQNFWFSYIWRGEAQVSWGVDSKVNPSSCYLLDNKRC